MAKARRPTPPQPPAAAGILARLQVAATSGGRTGLPTNLVGLQTALTRVGRSTASAVAEQEKLARAFALPGVRAQTGAILAQADAARNLAAATRDRLALEARSAAVTSGRYGKDLRAQQLLAREKQRVGDAEQGSQAEALADPAYRRTAVELLGADTRRRRERAAAQEQLSLDARRAAVKSGQYVKDLGQQRQLARERQKVEEAERRAALQAKYGRAGGALAFGAGQFLAHPLLRGGMGIAGSLGTAATGLAMSGFHGTVQGNRLALEWHMISREMAGAFMPAIRWATAALQMFRKWLERLSAQGQNLLMLGGLAAGGLGMAALARMGMAGVGGMLGLGGGAGVAAGVAGGTAAGMASRSGFLTSPYTVGAAASLLGIGKGVGYAGLAYGGFGGFMSPGMSGAGTASSPYAFRGRASGFARGALRTGGPLALMEIGHEAATGGYYSELRARGENKVASVLGSMGGGLMDFLSAPLKWTGITDKTYGEAFRERRGSGKGPFSTPGALAAFEKGKGDHRYPMIADAGFDAPGASFERITNRLALVDTGEKLPESTEDLLQEIFDFLKDTFGGSKPPPPPAFPYP